VTHPASPNRPSMWPSRGLPPPLADPRASVRARPIRHRHRPWVPLVRAVFPNRLPHLTPTAPQSRAPIAPLHRAISPSPKTPPPPDSCSRRGVTAAIVLRSVAVVSLLPSSLPSSPRLSLFFLAECLRVWPSAVLGVAVCGPTRAAVRPVWSCALLGAASGLRGSPMPAASTARPCPTGTPAQPAGVARCGMRGSPGLGRRPCTVVHGPRASLAYLCTAQCPSVLRAALVQLPCASFVESHQCPHSTTTCVYPSPIARRSSLPSPVPARSTLKSAHVVRAHLACRSHVSTCPIACTVPHVPHT
jgi:hypothetical protein